VAKLGADCLSQSKAQHPQSSRKGSGQLTTLDNFAADNFYTSTKTRLNRLGFVEKYFVRNLRPARPIIVFMKSLTRTQLVISWICRLTAAVILLQTLYFKFTGAPESIYIFTKVGMEPWGRYGSGVAELIASILLLTPRFAWAGAILAIGVLAGAIAFHLTVLGIVVQNDGGLLFGLAVAVEICCIIILILHRRQIPIVSRWFDPQKPLK
jgi:uncharacterized membrane protein YphA (DoxX/SURF4 family)